MERQLITAIRSVTLTPSPPLCYAQNVQNLTKSSPNNPSGQPPGRNSALHGNSRSARRCHSSTSPHLTSPHPHLFRPTAHPTHPPPSPQPCSPPSSPPPAASSSAPAPSSCAPTPPPTAPPTASPPTTPTPRPPPPTSPKPTHSPSRPWGCATRTSRKERTSRRRGGLCRRRIGGRYGVAASSHGRGR